MIKVSDYIMQYLANIGTRHIFMLTGGGAMHLNDSIGREKRIQYICNHHEQASAIAAEGYARVSGDVAVVCVTSGPGGTNALTGVLGQWLDSLPVLYFFRLTNKYSFPSIFTSVFSLSDLAVP